MQLSRGVLIALEGIDGSGKSTLARSLAESFRSQNIPVILTKEPGGTELGKTLRAMLQQQNIPLAPKAEYLLFAADRAQHMTELIKPSLDKNMMVISDRMGDSAIVYQGYGRGLDTGTIFTINRWAMNNRMPDLTIYVRVDLDTALQRIAARNEARTSFEQEKKEFFQKLIDGYDTLYKNNPNVLIINGQQSAQEVFNATLEQVTEWLNNHNLLH